jgi:hypothetical protein
MLHKKFALSFFALITSGCANLSTLQTARVEKPHEFKLTAGVGYEGVSSNQSGLPYFDGMGRFGLANQVDMGVKFTLLGTLGLDFKYQFVDMSRFAMAIGVGAGIFNFTTGAIYNLTAPLYISYDLSDTLSLYASPRFTLGFGGISFTLGNNTVNGNGTSLYIGSGLGARIGRKAGVLVEVSFMGGLNNNLPFLIDYSGAVYLGF